ncbi:Sortilin [Mycena venus]|uniref:Sortilin n=1 Tax=Mycena venus TaxID=2733690 RepID=A0A8H6X473_9AGAR|nr:Sortilin [Mycena venus]
MTEASSLHRRLTTTVFLLFIVLPYKLFAMAQDHSITVLSSLSKPLISFRDSDDVVPYSSMGPSGYLKIPGHGCNSGAKDRPGSESCLPGSSPIPIYNTRSKPRSRDKSGGYHPPKLPISQFYCSTGLLSGLIGKYTIIHESPELNEYLQAILVRLVDNSIWRSNDEGYTWTRLFPEESFLAFYRHTYAPGRAYLITRTNKFYATTDSGRTWHLYFAPTPPNTFRAQILRFHPDSDKLLWTGNKDCDDLLSPNCHAETQYSRNNGRIWTFVENYVVNCAWEADIALGADPTAIVCESYRDKTGNQRYFQSNNPLALVHGPSFFSNKRKFFDRVVGFAKFAEFWVVAEKLLPEKHSLELRVSTLGGPFVAALFPAGMHPESHAYTVLESLTGSLFVHMTTSEPPHPYWGQILKSDSNGTNFVISIDNVNRDDRGFVDFEKIIGLEGVALANVVADPQEAVLTGKKVLQTRITHNDGGVWGPLIPPWKDSRGDEYNCKTTSCALHLHGYTMRSTPEAGYSRSAIIGVLIAVGNVGESLAPYDQCDTFLSRDAGLTWEEIRKGPHVWQLGDSGGILVMAAENTATDHILFSINEGLTWRDYQFTDKKMRIRSILTVPSATTRRFILIGEIPYSSGSTVSYLDFSHLASKQCIIDTEGPGHGDFELWIPTNGHQMLFGRTTLYHRRVREANCTVGDQPIHSPIIGQSRICTEFDFECEFNHVKNETDQCARIPGPPLAPSGSCTMGKKYWYERAYRKISYSSCEGGETLDQRIDAQHPCPRDESTQHQNSLLFLAALWLIILVLFVGYLAYSSCLSLRSVYLPEDSTPDQATSGTLDRVMSIPLFFIRLAGDAWAWTAYRVRGVFRKREGEIHLPMDEEEQ